MHLESCVIHSNQYSDKKPCHAGYAYTKIIEAAKAERGELILVVLGPLTNVALACKLDPHLPARGKLMKSKHVLLQGWAADSWQYLTTALLWCCSEGALCHGWFCSQREHHSDSRVQLPL